MIAATKGNNWRVATTPGASVEWGTPPAVYMALDQEFDFTLDAAAGASNARNAATALPLPLPEALMRFVAPRCGLPEVTVAEGQLDYLTVTAAIQSGPPEALLLRVRLDANDRALVAAGHDLFISLLTFGGPMQPIAVAMGRDGVAPVEVGA